ncbi:MAG TPA: carboxypeptidase-like regulatory domain-containing protein, partial [Vicinamibacterales bacterium]
MVLGWAVAAGAGAAQQAPTRDGSRGPSTGTAILSGTVVAGDEAHTPIPHAVLTLSHGGGPGVGMSNQRTTATDETGRYVFPDLPAATYTLTAARGAYLTAGYGALNPGAPSLPIPLKDGQQFVAKPIVLVKGSVIAGRIT